MEMLDQGSGNANIHDDDDDDDFIDPYYGLNRDEKNRKRGRVEEPSLESLQGKKAKGPADDDFNETLLDDQEYEDDSENDGEVCEPFHAPKPLQYSSEYGSLVVKLINLGIVKHMKVPIPELNDFGHSQSFNDVLRDNQMLQRLVTRNGLAQSLEVSFCGKNSFVGLREVLTEQQRGPYGLFVWINVHDRPPKIIFNVKRDKQRKGGIHRIYHELLGFIYDTPSGYKCTVNSRTGWIDAVSLQPVSQQVCMQQLSAKAVSLLYGYENSDLFTPVQQTKEETFAIAFKDKVALLRSRNGLDLEAYDRSGNQAHRDLSHRDYNEMQWQWFAARLLDVDYNMGFEMSPPQRDSLRQIIQTGKVSYKDVIQSNVPDFTIALEGSNFVAKGKFSSRVMEKKLCQYCLFRRYATDAAGNWVCMRHIPNDGSAGLFCVYIYNPSPVQVELFKVGLSLVPERDAPIGRQMSHSVNIYDENSVICKKYISNSVEEALQLFFVASFVHNVLGEIANKPETHIRKRIGISIPKYIEIDFADMKTVLGIEIGATKLTPSIGGVRLEGSPPLPDYGVFFPAHGMRNKWFPYIYVKKYEMDASTSLFYIGKASARQGGMICDSKRDFGVHLENSVLVQTPDKKLLDTLESAAQLAYCLASILKIEVDGKKIVVANNVLVANGPVLDQTTFMDYVKLIFRHQFGHELIVYKRH